ncbi:MAG TPA: hypothetical protein VF623_00110 [Segetibacter sp.]|jgi:hypothetical protein
MCKPLLPVMQDFAEHLLWKTEHIATVHNHHGNDHAQLETAAAAHEEESGKTESSKPQEPISTHIFVQNTFSHPRIFITKQQYAPLLCFVFEFALQTNYPPPKFA